MDIDGIVDRDKCRYCAYPIIAYMDHRNNKYWRHNAPHNTAIACILVTSAEPQNRWDLENAR